jgi:hypothetical protein
LVHARSIERQFADLPHETGDHLGLSKFKGSLHRISVDIDALAKI